MAPNASVAVTNSETNVARSTVTNAAGIYSFPDLTPGIYQVRVAAAGFATIVKSNHNACATRLIPPVDSTS